jgi:hypothetical protein
MQLKFLLLQVLFDTLLNVWFIVYKCALIAQGHAKML